MALCLPEILSIYADYKSPLDETINRGPPCVYICKITHPHAKYPVVEVRIIIHFIQYALKLVEMSDSVFKLFGRGHYTEGEDRCAR